MRSVLTTALVTVAIAVAAPRVALACHCDKDTFASEARARPAIAAVVSGRIPTHTVFYFEQKIAHTEPLVGRPEATARHFDELATAYAALQRPGDAIHTLERKLARFGKDARTLVRLAEYHRAGDNFAKARAFVAEAVALATGPDAEVVRMEARVIEYRLRMETDARLPLDEDLFGRYEAAYIGEAPPPAKRAEWRAAGRASGRAEALATLIKEGRHQDPAVWFAFGKALAQDDDAHLAARALQRAASLDHPLGMKATCQALVRIPAYARWGVACYGPVDDFAREWERTANAEARRRAREEALLRRGKHATVFGY